MRTVSSNHAASGCYAEVFLSLLRQMVTMDTLAALGWSSCATGAGAALHTLRRRRGWLLSISKSGEEENCPGTIESRLSAYSVASDETKLLETSRGLG
jgi:hypothetical protein